MKINRNWKESQHIIQLLGKRKRKLEKIALQKTGVSLTPSKDLLEHPESFLILTQACAKGQELQRM